MSSSTRERLGLKRQSVLAKAFKKVDGIADYWDNIRKKRMEHLEKEKHK